MLRLMRRLLLYLREIITFPLTIKNSCLYWHRILKYNMLVWFDRFFKSIILVKQVQKWSLYTMLYIQKIKFYSHLTIMNGLKHLNSILRILQNFNNKVPILLINYLYAIEIPVL